LIETPRNRGQAHLLAISTRKTLSCAVTDVLVLRGNDAVIQSTVNNPGAEFTERGFTRLVNRAEGDDDLATCVGLRPTIPRHLYLKLLAKASDTVRQRLEAANPQIAAQVPNAVKEATRRARSAPSATTRNTEIAHALIKSLYADGRLDEFQVASFAEAGKLGEANASGAREPPGQRENQYFNSFDPASAPIAVISAVESVYQVATNSGESSVQCDAYSVAASPADSIPAMAPATAGRAGAP